MCPARQRTSSTARVRSWFNGTPGLVLGTREEPVSVLGVTVVDGRIAALDPMVDPAKLRHLA